MLECPNCEKRSISAWRKQAIGPLRKIRCPNCKAQISVGWLQSVVLSVVVWLLPLLWFIVLIEEGLLKAAIFAGLALIVIGAYQHFFVPLKIRSLPEDE